MDKALTLENAQRLLLTHGELAAADPDRPVYHLTQQAGWLNDPNGPIFHKGWYHMFYQLNPFWDIHGGGTSCWGHARSRDMVHWEHQPIALFPSFDRGEKSCYSGSCAIDGQGRPVIIYTSVHESEYDDAEQWAAVSDDDMALWKKPDVNPVMTPALHGGDTIRHWRDPMIFRHEGVAYMVIGGSQWLDGEPHGVVLLYRAKAADLLSWEYLGVVYRFEDPAEYLCEVPSLFPLGDKWVLIANPMARKCMIGRMDFEKNRFLPETEACPAWADFNIRVVQADADPSRVILWGFVADFRNQQKESRGWCNCMTLPRVLTIRPDGKMGVAPLEALDRLHQRVAVDEGEFAVVPGAPRSIENRSDCLELRVSLVPERAAVCGVRIRCSGDQSRYVSIQVEAPTPWNKGPHLVVTGNGLRCTPAKIPFALAGDERSVDMRVYLDKSVLELFVNGRVSYTGVLELVPGECGASLFADGGSMHVRSVRAREMGVQADARH